MRHLAPALMAALAAALLAPSPGSPVQDRPADDRETQEPPAGAFVLTPDHDLVIEGPVVPDGDGEKEAWTLRIADGDPHELEARGENRWAVPDLHLTLERAADGDGLRMVRYGEPVTVRPEGSVTEARHGERPLGEALDELTPRLMMALDVPGVSVAVVEDGEIARLAQYGVTTAGETEPVTRETVFEAASMSKPAYAYPFLGLVEEGRMDLDGPLVEYLGEDYIEGEELHRKITARMVLSHTTGFPNWRGDDGLTVRFEPGTEIGYSGEGFQFLQTAVEEVTGQSTEAFTRERLLEPLGMASSSYAWTEAYEETYATGHTSSGEPRDPRPYEDANTAYTLYTTPEDYARFLVEMVREDRGADHSLAAETLELMLSSQEVPEGRSPIARGEEETEGEVHFALGWRFDEGEAGGRRYWHSGSNSTGFQCYAEFDPETGDGIVVMTNSSSGSPLWRALMRELGLELG